MTKDDGQSADYEEQAPGRRGQVDTNTDEVEDRGLELDPEPALDATASGDETPQWFAATSDGRRWGPMPVVAIQEMVRSGSLSPENLVWCRGMENWKPVGDLPSFWPLIRPEEASGALSNPDDWRGVGGIAAIIGGLVLLGSLMLWYWGYTWFSGVLGLVMIFLLCHFAGAVLERLDKIESALSGKRGEKASENDE